MRWSRIQLIFRRELRDQLRDRRTMFMVFVLPLLLYPILGFVVTQLSAAFEQRPRRVLIVGAEHLPDEPPLLVRSDEGGVRFNPRLVDVPDETGALIVQLADTAEDWSSPRRQLAALRSEQVDAIVMIPPETREQIESLKKPEITIAYDRASERSQFTYYRIEDIIHRWQQAIVARRLIADEKPEEYVDPVSVQPIDLARQVLGSSASAGGVWAKLFPFLLVMMSLTGAFYPAVDLCAGEKERGTMETLLISPAYRSEIVVGKFLTVMAASVATALLNLASMGLTMSWVAGQIASTAMGASPGGADPAMGELQPPSMAALGWIIVLLVPLSAFFSAICLSLAVLARSMKEGQYYMTPLYLVAMPLIFLTLMPGVELNPFYSLVPVTGVSLLLKDLMLEQYVEARQYFMPVLISTLVYGAIALRWAVGQFRTEEVLFREAERFDLIAWLRHLIRDRGPTPSSGQAIACFAIILAMSWYTSMLMVGADPLVSLAVGQLVFILGPPVVMAWLFTSSPRTTLRLRWPGWGALAIGFGLALAMNPLVHELRPVVEDLFPIPDSVARALAQLTGAIPNLPTAILLLAVLPAVCEEMAFRGYILSGLESGHRTWTAIILSAFLFGFLHVLLSLFQQLFNAALLGLVLGLLAVRTRSLFPGIVFHLTNNALAVLSGSMATGAPDWLYRNTEQVLYHWPWVLLGAVLSAAMLAWLARDVAEIAAARTVEDPAVWDSIETTTTAAGAPRKGPPSTTPDPEEP